MIFYATNRSIQNWMKDLKLKTLSELLTVGKIFLKVDN